MLTAIAFPVVTSVYAKGQQPGNNKVGRLIVKLKPNTEQIQSFNAAGSQSNNQKARLQNVIDRVLTARSGRLSINRMSATADVAKNMQPKQSIDKDTVVLSLGAPLARADADQLMKDIAADKSVEYVEEDVKLQHFKVPNDARYQEQWSLSTGVGGANLPAAWDLTLGSSDVVVAIIDTGYLPHGDLKDNLVPGSGYDFISDEFTANRGSLDVASDGKDYGDWISDKDIELYPECGPFESDSSWHGSHVSGIVGAATDNGIGIAGISWKGKILPVRVLGKCGGYTSDIIKGMRWAAGLSTGDAKVPVNNYPAKVLNLSLGGYAPDQKCSRTFSNAIKDIKAAGASIVVAAGNSGEDVSYSEPANCDGVIAVSANDISGELTYFSNYGPKVKITAPGDDILSTVDAGKMQAEKDSYVSYRGTSMAAPHVSGAIALMLAANPKLTPDQVLQILQSSVKPFPVGSQCVDPNNPDKKDKCGPGLLDVGNAVGQAMQGGY